MATILIRPDGTITGIVFVPCTVNDPEVLAVEIDAQALFHIAGEDENIFEVLQARIKPEVRRFEKDGMNWLNSSDVEIFRKPTAS